jgi:predicted metal-dependent enzyme (double-stranded beta helix superfamily)
MKWKVILALLLVAAGVAALGGKVGATPSNSLFSSSTIARAQLGELNIKSQLDPDVWKMMLKTKGLSDLYVQQNVFKPGATSGWHTHPGPSLVIVTQGTVTVYEGDDPTCTPHEYSASSQGTGFVDIGGGAVHVIRNEGTVDAQTIVVQLIPAGAARRIDAPDPGTCPF